jgi:pyrimidine operon attenuation protein / uracil phosphoribosyltransferase
MEKERVLILDKERIDRKLQRMAYQIWENNSHETEVTLIGIVNGGLAVAESLAERLRQISPLQVHVIPMKLDKKQPMTSEITFKENFNGRSVIIVDDVANSGKTLLYAIKPLLAFEVKKIMVAVLVDRKHKSFPVSSDIVGHSVATTLQEHIEVETNNSDIIAAYLQ